MRLEGVIYECLDGREGSNLVSGIVRLLPIAGGLEVHAYGGGGAQLVYEDDDLEDNEAQESIIVRTPQGTVRFVKLQLADFNRLEGPSLFDTPEFKTTEQLQKFFWKRMTANYF